nr:lipase family protein [Corynebacterium anserum]
MTLLPFSCLKTALTTRVKTSASSLRHAVAFLGSVALVGGSLAAEAAPAHAQSSDVIGSFADVTPASAVDLGEAPHPLPDYGGTPVDSGLVVGTPPAETGKAMNEVSLDPSVGLSSAAVQQRFSYSTVNQHGEVAASTASLFLPKGPAPKGGWPVLAWAHGTVGLGDQCTPSMNPQGERDHKYLIHWLEEGYAIVATDYVGLGSPGMHSYLNGKVNAANVVDSVIASRELEEGQELSKKWAVIGQSQGGGSALHVALSATKRSADAGLDYRGAVATGAPAYIEEIVLAAGPTFPPVPLPSGLSVYSLYILAAFQEAHPEVDLNSALTDEGRQMIAAAKKSCNDQTAAVVKGVNVARAFRKPLRDVPGLATALRDFMSTPTSGYDKPVFLGHGLTDIDVPSPIGVVLNSDMWLTSSSVTPRNGISA